MNFPKTGYTKFCPLLVWANIIIGKRREEIVLASAHIGHSYMTHSYLYKGDSMPECIPRYCALTVKHILIECVNFMEVHHQYFDVADFKTLFKDVDPS